MVLIIQLLIQYHSEKRDKSYNHYTSLYTTVFNTYFDYNHKKNLKSIITIQRFFRKYMKENSIDIIIDKKNIFMAKSNNDITEDILKIVNAKIK